MVEYEPYDWKAKERERQIIPGVNNLLTLGGAIGGYQAYQKFDKRQEAMLQALLQQQQLLLFQIHQQQCGPNCNHFPAYEEQVVAISPPREPGTVTMAFAGLWRLFCIATLLAIAWGVIWFIFALVHEYQHPWF